MQNRNNANQPRHGHGRDDQGRHDTTTRQSQGRPGGDEQQQSSKQKPTSGKPSSTPGSQPQRGGPVDRD